MNCITRHCLVLTFLFLGFSLRAGGIFPVDTIHNYTVDCNSMTDICLPMPALDLSGYSFFVDGNPYSAGMAGCDFDTTITYSYSNLFGLGNLGPYQINSWTVNNTTHSGQFNSINELVALMNAWDPLGNWVHNPASFSIEGGASGSNYTDMEVTVMMNQTPSTIGLNFSLMPQGTMMDFSEGMHSLIVIDNSTNDRDTLMVMVECLLSPPPTTITATVSPDSLPHVVCLDTTELAGNITDVFNACPDESGLYVNFYLDPVNLCVKYQGLICGGTETACFVMCDDFGICDTTYFEVTVEDISCLHQSQKLMDTIFINFTETVCIDTTGLPGDIIAVENICPDESGESVVFEYEEDTHCVTYTGIAEGLDQACYLLIDQYGNTDTATVCVYVRLPENGIIIDTILIGSSETYCIDTTELAGNILNIENFCPTLSGNEVEFTIDDVTLCVEAQSLAIGTDTACIVLCDDYNVCDTTYLFITVVSDESDPCYNAPPPVAVDDAATTQLNTPVNIDILANDTLGPCLPFTLTVLDETSGGTGPHNGLTVKNMNQTVDYVPDPGFCGTDSFQYVLCNQIGCDTATVFVEISCTETEIDSIIIYDGFSPNRDGINEFFTIKNIEKYPQSTVSVYNRWGNLVFSATGYKNTWDGTYRASALPDGTYFYMIELDTRTKFTGPLQIHR